MKQFLVALLIVTAALAHKITDPFVGTNTDIADSSLALLRSSSPEALFGGPFFTPFNITQSVDSLAPTNWRINCPNTNSAVDVFPLTQTAPTVYTKPAVDKDDGVTLLGWYKIGNYTAEKLQDPAVRGCNLAYITYDIKTPNNPNSPAVTGWLELNKTRTKMLLITHYTPLAGAQFQVTWDSIPSNTFAALDTINYHLIGFSHIPINPHYPHFGAIITFYIDGKTCGTDTIAYPAHKNPISCGVGGQKSGNEVINPGTAYQRDTRTQNPGMFYVGGVAVYWRSSTTAQIKTMYDTMQTHNLRYQRSISAVELAPTKTVTGISCASLNPIQVRIPGNTLQIVTVNGKVLYTIQTSTGSIMLPGLTTGRYFLKTDNNLRPIIIVR